MRLSPAATVTVSCHGCHSGADASMRCAPGATVTVPGNASACPPSTCTRAPAIAVSRRNDSVASRTPSETTGASGCEPPFTSRPIAASASACNAASADSAANRYQVTASVVLPTRS